MGSNPTLSANQFWRYITAIKNASEASEIVRDFLIRMGWSVFVAPLKAEESNGKWIVLFRAGIKDMKFELNSQTGEIIKYDTLE